MPLLITWPGRRGFASARKYMLHDVRVAAAPHHIVQEVMMDIDENVEGEQEQARTVEVLVVGENRIEETRHAHEAQKAEEGADADEHRQIGKHARRQPAAKKRRRRAKVFCARIQLITPNHGQILQRVEGRNDRKEKRINLY